MPRAGREPSNGIPRGAGARDGPEVSARDRQAVGVGDAKPGDPPSRAPILDDHGLVPAPEDPLVGPLAQRGQHGQQRLTLAGQPVLEPLALAPHVHTLEDPVVDQMLEPCGEDVLGDAEAALEVPETTDAEEGVAHDEEGPPVPQDLEGLTDPAVHVGEALPPHGPSIAPDVWLHQATKWASAKSHERTAECP